jgi:outer membrane protein assembly factor BamB
LAVATGATAVVGIDPATGAVVWTVDRAQGMLVPPAIDPAFAPHGLVIYVEGAGLTSAVVAIDLETRVRKWSTALEGSVMGGPAIDGGHVFVGVHDGSVVALDESSGQVSWKATTAGPVDASPAVSAGKVYAVSEPPPPTRAHLYAMDAASGHVVWSYIDPRLSDHTSSPTVAEGRVFVGFGDVTVRAFDAGTGKLLWREPVRGDFEPTSSPAFWNGGLFLEDAEGSVYRLDSATGRRIWDFRFTSLSISAAPMVAAGTLYAGLDDGSIAAIDASSGHLVWRTTLRFGPIGSLASAGDLLVAPVIGPKGGIAAFQTDPSGRLLDIHSPTELHPGVALANYAVAFVLMLGLLYGLFAVLARRAVPPGAEHPVSEPLDDPELPRAEQDERDDL